MILLALTTSTEQGSVALWRDGKIVALSSWTKHQQSSEALIVKIKSLLTKTHLKPAQLTSIAVDKGPGSFTGCRVSVNVAKTFAYTLNIPVIPLFSLDVIASAVATRADGRILCVLDAHKSLLYSRWYEAKDGVATPTDEIKAAPASELAAELSSSVIVAGQIPPSALEIFKQTGAKISKRKDETSPRAKVLAELASTYSDFSENWRYVEPTYVRAPEAVEKLMSTTSG